MEPKKLLKPKYVAGVLGISERKVRRMVLNHQIVGIYVGEQIRIHPDDLESYIASKRTT